MTKWENESFYYQLAYFFKFIEGVSVAEQEVPVTN